MSKNISRQISYLLRHNPEDLEMDKQGWVNVNDLLKKLKIDKDYLDFIVENNDKKRFGFNEDGTKIRAHQGHSKDLNLEITFKEVQFPTTYYHGTTFLNKNSILNHGLQRKKRAHVHLSKDIETAVNVGNRHIKRGETVIVLEIDGNKMKQDGHKIWESENGVILTDKVDSKYIKLF